MWGHENMNASLPMYDWPECRLQTDGFWQQIRKAALSIDPDIPLPQALMRAEGGVPSSLWNHADMVFTQTCWGPLSLGLVPDAYILAQADYSAFEGGRDQFYRSALVARIGDRAEVPDHKGATELASLISARRFAYNGRESLSGLLSVCDDLKMPPERLTEGGLRTGSHRGSVQAVATGGADIAAIDCRSWELAKRYEPDAASLVVVGWTSERVGLPYITRRDLDEHFRQVLSDALSRLGCFPPARSGNM